jgi:uncharacterized membrane protein
MFELKFRIKAEKMDRRLTIFEETETQLRQQFSAKIVDVSRWNYESHPVDDEFLVSVNYQTRDPHEVRKFITNVLRFEAVSLTNLVTQRNYPLNRRKWRRKMTNTGGTI